MVSQIKSSFENQQFQQLTEVTNKYVRCVHVKVGDLVVSVGGARYDNMLRAVHYIYDNDVAIKSQDLARALDMLPVYCSVACRHAAELGMLAVHSYVVSSKGVRQNIFRKVDGLVFDRAPADVDRVQFRLRQLQSILDARGVNWEVANVVNAYHQPNGTMAERVKPVVDYVNNAPGPVSSRDIAAHLKMDSRICGTICSRAVDYGLIQSLGIVRRGPERTKFSMYAKLAD